MVGVRHVLAGELRDGVGPARLADGADGRDLALADVVGVGAEDLARREVDESLERALCAERSLERVVGADHVHAHRPHRALEHGLDAGDRRAVDEVRGAAGELLQPLAVEHVGLVEREVRVRGEVGAGQRVAVEVVHRDDLVAVDELAGERRRDEAGAAGDQDPLTLEHAAEAYVRSGRGRRGPGGGRRERSRPRRAPRRAAPPRRRGRSGRAATRASGRRGRARGRDRARRAPRRPGGRTPRRRAAGRPGRRRGGAARPRARSRPRSRTSGAARGRGRRRACGGPARAAPRSATEHERCRRARPGAGTACGGRPGRRPRSGRRPGSREASAGQVAVPVFVTTTSSSPTSPATGCGGGPSSIRAA